MGGGGELGWWDVIRLAESFVLQSVPCLATCLCHTTPPPPDEVMHQQSDPAVILPISMSVMDCGPWGGITFKYDSLGRTRAAPCQLPGGNAPVARYLACVRKSRHDGRLVGMNIATGNWVTWVTWGRHRQITLPLPLPFPPLQSLPSNQFTSLCAGQPMGSLPISALFSGNQVAAPPPMCLGKPRLFPRLGQFVVICFRGGDLNPGVCHSQSITYPSRRAVSEK